MSTNTTLQTRNAISPQEAKAMDTDGLRQNFLLDVFSEEGFTLYYTHYDRAIVGGITLAPGQTYMLACPEVLKAEYFLERREAGLFCIQGKSVVEADTQRFEVSKNDCLYLTKGTKEVSIHNAGSDTLKIYLFSAPAHAIHQNALCKEADANPTTIGAQETANLRTINKYIHLEGIKSCQIVMGMTRLNSGSVWNTMPPHTHDRRMEAYLYYDLPADARVLHLMGEPNQTRSLLVADGQAVLSPPWSIHCGAGTQAYSFIWAMAGENQVYQDMDHAPLATLR